MKSKTLIAISLACVALAACSADPATRAASPAPTEPPATSIEPTRPSPTTSASTASEPVVLPKLFSKKKAMVHVRKLAGDIGVRTKATQPETDAAAYVARHFTRYGYEVTIERFSVPEGTSRNVVARWPGSKTFPFVIGGHMDTVPGSPGANDNASGVAVVLELARMFAGTPQADFVHFAAFGAEEYGANQNSHHDGSAAFVRRIGTEGRSRLAGMTSVDMVADGRPLLVGNSGIASDVVARTLYNKIGKKGIDVRFITLCDCSDHGPFEHAGIPASFAYSGQEPNYHSPSDTVPNMKPDDLSRTGRAMRVFVKAMDKQMLDRFRRSR